MKRIETLSINELIELFREYGIPCSYETIRETIKQDKLPFATGVMLDSGKHYFLIFKKGAIEWLESKT